MTKSIRKQLSTWLLIFLLALFFSESYGFAQSTTAISVSSTVVRPHVKRFGQNIDGNAPFGGQQLSRHLFFAYGGFMPSQIYRNTFQCVTGSAPSGSITTTSWFNNTVAAPAIYPGYPTNFWNGATYHAYAQYYNTAYTTTSGNTVTGTITSSSQNGADLATVASSSPYTVTVTSGTVSLAGIASGSTFYVNYLPYTTTGTSTATSLTLTTAPATTGTNVTVSPTNGLTLGLSGTLSKPCQNNDELVVTRLAYDTTLTPNQGVLSGNVSPTATWDTADFAPSPNTNTTQSLVLPAGGFLNQIADAPLADATSPTSPSTQRVWINLNGNGYVLSYDMKCSSATSCPATINLCRQNSGATCATTYVSTTDDPTSSYVAGNGNGWVHYSHTFNASETGSQTGLIKLTMNLTGGGVKLQNVDLLEPAQFSGNSSIFRDAVFEDLKSKNLGAIRHMNGALICWDLDDAIAPIGNRRGCNGSAQTVSTVTPYTVGSWGQLGYEDLLELDYALGVDDWQTISPFFTPTEMTNMTEFLCGPYTSTYGAKRDALQAASGQPHGAIGDDWCSLYAAKGLNIWAEIGNEEWTNGAGTNFNPNDDGASYAQLVGPLITAMKSATDYNGSTLKLVANGWYPGNQYYGGWSYGLLNVLGCTLGNRATCPDAIDVAPYMLHDLGTGTNDISTSGSNLTGTGGPFDAMFAENSNVESTASTTTNSVYSGNSYVLSNWGVPSGFYEANFGAYSYPAAITSQNEEDQAVAGVGNAIGTVENLALAQRDAGLGTVPLNIFSYAEAYNFGHCNGTGCTSGLVVPVWRTTKVIAAGPGQVTSSNPFTIQAPLGLALTQWNNAVGNNSSLMQVTQSGTPTYSYAGGQIAGGSNTIAANSTVPYVTVTAYSNVTTTGSCIGTWTIAAFNRNLTTANPITIGGACAPTAGTVVTKQVFGGANAITDHNEASNLNNIATAPVVALSSPTTVTGLTSDTLPKASMTTYTYTLTSGGTGAAPISIGGLSSAAGATVIH